MRLTLLSSTEYSSTVLPEKCAGHYWVHGRGADGKIGPVVAVEAVHSTDKKPVWTLKSNCWFQILGGNGCPVQSERLNSLEMYRIVSKEGTTEFVLFAEPLSSDWRRYNAYEIIGGGVVLTIGREPGNSIVFANPFVSQEHATLTISKDGIFIRDQESDNGTYVNGRAVACEQIYNGNMIYIMGLQIIVVGRFIFLNHPFDGVTVSTPYLRPYHTPSDILMTEPEDTENVFPDTFYYRAPRFKYDIDTFELKIDAPPANQNSDEMPIALLIGPSMTMGMASIATGTFAVLNAISRSDIMSALPTMVMSLSMLMGTMLWPLVTRTYQRRMKRQKESRRQETYQDYLARIEKIIAEETLRQEKVLRENDPCLQERIQRILAPVPSIWERTKKHTDFLSLRLGQGNLPLNINLQFPERKFTIEKDNLEDALYSLTNQPRWLSNVPVCLSLAQRFISGIYAPSEVLRAYAVNLILQIVSLHGYDEVKLAVIYNAGDADLFAFTHWLPHTMDQEQGVRFIASDSDEVKRLSSVLDSVIEYRKGLSESQLEDEMPYFILLCLDKDLAVKAECVRRVQEYKKNLRFSVLSMFNRLEDLPKECSAVVELRNQERGSLVYINDVSEPPIPFRTDLSGEIDIRGITRVLANTMIDTVDARFTFPKQYSFLEMLDIGMVEHLNLTECWAANDPVQSLATTIGIDKYGEPFRLDLHQNAHGPHGLIAGMTGSGKSEFIISYILSMAINFHPYEVAFILIDYKGGGMAEAFQELPHTAGIITNLEGGNITRSLASLRSELQRRERIFKSVSTCHSMSNIDIYKYQKLFREHKVNEPLPHLFIIADEFAELKKEQSNDKSNFMGELTSAARVGRSLGVHLILATQKPSGIVDDQIRSNSRFRISLKVQDRADSTEMLGRPDAAALVDTGRFYLMVGNDELFQIGQSAWAGAPYYPSPSAIRNQDDGVSIIDVNGRVIAEANTNRFVAFQDPQKQLDVLTKYITKVGKDEGIVPWKMWLDPIPARIYVDMLLEKYKPTAQNRFFLEPVVGELDDPSNQRQDILRVPLTREGNAIVYGSAGSGKAMFLEAMCYSLLESHSPQELNLYILDFDTELMTAFSSAPQVGGVILSNESEKVNNLFKMLLGKLETRKKLLAAFGGDFAQYNAQSQQLQPNLVVMINNFAAFMELYEDRFSDLYYVSREGTKYGIYFVLTCSGINNVRLNLRQNFSCIYCLQLNNPDDYSSVVGKTEGLQPAKFRGRGMYRSENALLEFQTACVTETNPPYEYIQTFSKHLCEQYPNQMAANVPILPKEVSVDFLTPYCIKENLDRIPIGVEKVSLEIAYYPFAESSLHLLLSANQEWQDLAEPLAALVSGPCGIQTMVFAQSPRHTLGHMRYFSDLNSSVSGVNEIYQTVLTRNNTYKDMLEKGAEPPQFKPLFVIIESPVWLKKLLDRYHLPADQQLADDDTPFNRLQTAMLKCEPPYQVFFLLAESIHQLGPFTAEDWYKTQVRKNTFLWVGSGINDQFQMNVTRKVKEHNMALENGFGFAVCAGTETLVKLLQENREDM